MVNKRLCACGCGDRVTPKVESQHMNVLTPAVLASQVLDQNRELIRRKKRSQAIGFPAPFRRLAMENTTAIDDMDHDVNDPVSLNFSTTMGDEVYGQLKARHSAMNHAGSSGLSNINADAVLPDSPNEDCYMDHAGPSALSDDEDIYMDHAGPSASALSDDEDIYMDHLAPSPHDTHNDDSLLPSPHNNAVGMGGNLDGEVYGLDHPAPSPHDTPSPRDDDIDAGMKGNLDDGVYGLSNLRRSRRIAGCVEKIGQQRWGSNVPVDFVNNREESDDEEEDIEDDGDFDVASDEGLEGYDHEEDDVELFAGPGQEGISLWDSLGEGFLREVSQLGML
jgi:hypothetical protein